MRVLDFDNFVLLETLGIGGMGYQLVSRRSTEAKNRDCRMPEAGRFTRAQN